MPRSSLIQKFRGYTELVKFSHTVFALPFALSELVIIARFRPVTKFELLMILLALVSARTAAMSWNRVVDVRFDRLNPRTSNREIPRGEVSVASAVILTILSCVIFTLAAAALGKHCLVFSPWVLAILLGYSFAKRFTSAAHLILGLALALAPGGVWYALTGQISWQPIPLMLAVLLWVAGFDILYSTQDVEFDRKQQLFSIPANLGVPAAFSISRILHLITLVCLIYFGYVSALSTPYFIGLFIFAALLVSEHVLMSKDDPSLIDAAFFTRNGLASIVFLVAVVLGS